MAKKIICTVITDPNYDQRMQRICTALTESGYDVLLLGRSLPHSTTLVERPYTQKRMNLLFKTSMLFYAEYNIRLFFFLLFARFDLICSIDLDSILPGWIVSRLKNKVFVHDAHELFSEMPELDENKLAKNTWTTIEQAIFPKMRYAYTESEGYQAIYKEKYPNTDFAVIRNVPFYYETNRQIGDGEYILYQGALNVGRGLESAILAMHNIDYKLVLAGEGELSNDLRALVKKEQLEHKVEFLGMITPNELREVTNKAKIGINLLTPTNRHYQLSFPNKLFDYMMAELPQISMNFQYYQEIIGSETIGILIDDLEVATIEAAIKKLLNDEELYQRAISSCNTLKEIHNWDREKTKLYNFYENIEKVEWS